MADSHSSRVPLSPVELVGNRIDENRLFEARFLFQKFTTEIDPAVGEKLRKQLETRIARAEQTFAKGELLEHAGELEKALQVYVDLAARVVDYPSLVEARQRVELAIKLGPLEPVEPLESEGPVPESSPSVVRPEVSASPVSGASFFQHRKVALAFVFSLLAVLGGASFWIFFRTQGEPPVVVRPVVESEPEAAPRVEEPASRSSVTRPVPEPAAAAPEIMVADQKTTSEPMAVEVGTNEQTAVLSAFPAPAEEKSDEKEQPLATREEPASERISDSSVSIPVAGPVASTEGEGKAAAFPVQEPLQKSALSPGSDGQAVAGGAAQEQEDSHPEPHVVPEISSRKEVALASVEQEENAVVQDGSLETNVSGPVVDPAETESSDPAGSAGTGKIYTVQAGDTLETIAARVYGNRYKWSQLVAANKEKLGRPPYVLLVGMRLRVPPLESSSSGNGAILLNDDGTYTVQSGDSLGSIALKLYGASWKWNTLYQLNRDRLPTPEALRVGQKLLVNKKNIPDAGNKNPVGE